MIKELEDKLAEAVALVESVKKEIAESKELKPYDWKTGKSFLGINHEGLVGPRMPLSVDSLFNFDEKEEGERFAHKLKVLSCINNLKKSLGCDWEFKHDHENFYIEYISDEDEWSYDYSRTYQQSLIYFGSGRDADKVADYLNKHYPNGWSLRKS